MSGCWKNWNGLEEVTEVTAFWGEGIGRNSHTLGLQELGGLTALQSSLADFGHLVMTLIKLLYGLC